ncbi:hypothetical protein BKA81DRAFT_119835 [Phyllosticta paracitricarpa]
MFWLLVLFVFSRSGHVTTRRRNTSNQTALSSILSALTGTRYLHSVPHSLASPALLPSSTIVSSPSPSSAPLIVCCRRRLFQFFSFYSASRGFSLAALPPPLALCNIHMCTFLSARQGRLPTTFVGLEWSTGRP